MSTENVNDNKQTTNCADDISERQTLLALDIGRLQCSPFS